MSKKDDDFRKKLLATFKIEASEHLQAISAGLIQLEIAPAGRRPELVEVVFREAHSLKGAARSVNLADIERLCQRIEGVFAVWKRGEAPPTPELFDILHRIVDHLRVTLLIPGEPAGAYGHTPLPAAGVFTRQIEDALRAARVAGRGVPEGEMAAEAVPEEPDADGFSLLAGTAPVIETIRIPAARLDAVLRQVEEMLSARLAAGQRAVELRALHGEFAAQHRQSARRDPATAVALAVLEQKVARLARVAERDHRALGSMVDNLLEDMKQALMLPLASLLELFPKFVRDLSRDQGKEVTLDLRGAEIEIDRRILEEIKDPLIHLVRNAIDHGIERPAERERLGKTRVGTVTIAIAQENGGWVGLRVADDGAGIDVDAVVATAVQSGFILPEAASKMSEPEAQALVFHSGVTTSALLTDISGRGLGLAIVQEKVERLGGAIALESKPGAGTTFRIRLPLTLATFRGVLVRAGNSLFVLPILSVERVVRVRPEAIRTVENRKVLTFNGTAVSVVHLADALQMSSKLQPASLDGHLFAVVMGPATRQIAFLVDEVVGEQEVLVKTLGQPLARVRNVSGATVLGSGKVVPILNAADLLKSAVKAARAPAAAPLTQEDVSRRILVTEDSITSRMLLKNILEAAGYHVRVAVDGAQALALLHTEAFDLLVSDVDMPRLNGFDLTAKIRADQKLAGLPIVLVTALESREEQERGIEAGANAYIVKSSFEQSNLLEVVGRLL